MTVNRTRLLVADDEATQRAMLSKILARAGYDVETAADGDEVRRALERETFHLVLTDQRMPAGGGLEVVRHARRLDPPVPVVLMTAYGSVADAVEAMKEGAADYLCKPFEPDELLLVLHKALRQARLEEEVESLHGVLRERCRLGNLIGTSPAMQRVLSMVERIGPCDVPVLIRGESGTGKELLARAIHAQGPRARGPFVAVNCAAVPSELLESEFFGHERGAFTGAVRARAGRFEEANGGTLLLDEIGAMRVDLQAKLLRALQEKEIQRLGGRGSVPIDVRILAATGENLEEAIRHRAFREDLFYRLNVVPIVLPPLRERPEDVPLLVDHFLSRAAARFGRAPACMAADALELLVRYPWPGNVRELESCIDRMVLLSRADRLTVDDVPPGIVPAASPGAGPEERFELPAQGVALDALERHLIAQALRRTRGVLGPAARLLGISYKTLQYRLEKHGLDRLAAESGSGPGSGRTFPLPGGGARSDA